MKLVRDLRGHMHLKETAFGKKKMFKRIGALTMAMSMLYCSAAFASTTATIDTSVFTTITTGCKAVLGLFTEFPINVFLAASILGIAVGVIRKVKRG